MAHVRNANHWLVLTEQSLQVIRYEIWRTVGVSVFWLAAVLVLSLALARATSWRVTRPLALLLARVRDLAAGKVPEPTLPEFAAAPAEILELASSFDQMSAQLTSSYRALSHAKRDLEFRVEERTVELARMNAALKAEIAAGERTRATLLLRDRAIAEANEGVTIADATVPGTPVIYANSGFERITGYSREETVGRSGALLSGRGTDPATIRVIREAVEQGRECSVEVLHYRKDGSEYWERLSITPVHDESGHLTNFIGIHSDITHQKHVENLKTQLVSTVSHELRTPLTSIKGFTELLLEQEYPREKQVRFLGIVQQETTRLNRLVDDFLDLQRMDSGRETYRFAPVDLAATIGHVRDALAGVSRKHELRVDVRPALPPVAADEARIRQVLTNLLSNAIKFSPGGGIVEVGAESRDGIVVCRGPGFRQSASRPSRSACCSCPSPGWIIRKHAASVAPAWVWR